MKLTIREINEKRGLLQMITSQEGSDKLNYAIAKLNKRFDQSTRVIQTAFDEAAEDLRILNAAVYPDGFEAKEKIGLFVLNAQQGYTFTRAGTNAFNAAVRPLNETRLDQVVEIVGDPYFADPAWPRVADVSLFIKEELGGLLFEESPKVGKSESPEEAAGADALNGVTTDQAAIPEGENTPQPDNIA